MLETGRKLLLKMPPEVAHELTLDMLGAASRLGVLACIRKSAPQAPVRLMGIDFPNPVGLAAGMDKNAEAVRGFEQLGLGFVEVGTVTPRPQLGNPRPRLFRIPGQEAIINRMGFNSQGLDAVVRRLKSSRHSIPVGFNLGKNLVTPVEQAHEDYVTGMRAAWMLADYLAINISSPNTPGLRGLQFGEELQRLLDAIGVEREMLVESTGKHTPICVKIAPDMTEQETRDVTRAILVAGMDGIIATNTTLDRSAVQGLPHADESGGLSGRPLCARSLEVLRIVRDEAGSDFPIIGVGGIMTGGDAAQRFKAGADLVQIYTGLIYRGDGLIREIVDAWPGRPHVD